MLGEPNPNQWERYAQNNCVFHYELPHSYQYMRNWNRGYMEWAQRMRIRRWGDPVHHPALLRGAAELSPRGRRASGPAASRPSACASGCRNLFRPAAVLLRAARGAGHRPRASTRSPRSPSGRWRCTTRGTRRTRGCVRSTDTITCSSTRAPRVRRESRTAAGCGSNRAGARCAACAAHSEAVEPGTVWTWNAIGKAAGRLEPRARRQRGAQGLPAQPPDQRRAAARRRRACRTRIRSPARPAGTT